MGIYPSLKNSALHCFFHSGFAPLALAFAGRRVDSHQKIISGRPKGRPARGPAQTCAAGLRGRRTSDGGMKKAPAKAGAFARTAVREDVEQMMGIEPTRPAWEAGVLPLNYICTNLERYLVYSMGQEKSNTSVRKLAVPLVFAYFLKYTVKKT